MGTVKLTLCVCGHPEGGHGPTTTESTHHATACFRAWMNARGATVKCPCVEFQADDTSQPASDVERHGPGVRYTEIERMVFAQTYVHEMNRARGKEWDDFDRDEYRRMREHDNESFSARARGESPPPEFHAYTPPSIWTSKAQRAVLAALDTVHELRFELANPKRSTRNPEWMGELATEPERTGPLGLRVGLPIRVDGEEWAAMRMTQLRAEGKTAFIRIATDPHGAYRLLGIEVNIAAPGDAPFWELEAPPSRQP